MNKREVGSRFEQEAAEFLTQNGYEIIAKNYRCRTGEIDLIARNDGYLCFIEVKYRSSTYNGFPSEAIDLRKMKRIIRTAEYYLLINRMPQTTPCRFDAVAILDHEFSLIKNAFDMV